MTQQVQEVLEAIKFCNSFCMFQLLDLRDISNDSKDQLVVTKSSFNVNEAITEVLNMYKMQAALKKITVSLNMHMTVPS